MSRRRRRKRKEEKPGLMARLFAPDARLLLTVGIPASIIAAIILGSRDGFWFSFPVCYVWMTGIFFVFILRLIILGKFVLPPTATHFPEDSASDTPRGWPSMREGVRLLFHHALLWLPPQIRGQLGFTGLKNVPEELPDSFQTYRAGIVPSHMAIAMGGLNTFSRAAGPGYVRVGKSDRILTTIDLRIHSRSKEISATTRDGIPLTTTVSALFMVRQPAADTQVDPSIPYPYTSETLFRLLYADSREADEETVHWSARICPSIETTVVNEIARYYFDELFRPPGTTFNEQHDVPVVHIRTAIRENLNQQLREKFEFDEDHENPIHIISADFSELIPPQEVVDQRIAAWRTEWEMEQQRSRQELQTQAVFDRRVAQTTAQKLVIENIIDTIADIEGTANVDLSEVIHLRLLEALDRIIEDSQLSSDLADESIDQQITDILLLLSEQLAAVRS